MIERFCDTLLLHKQNPEKTVDVVPHNEGNHTRDFAGLLLLGYKLRLAWERCHVAGCGGLCWKTVGRFLVLTVPCCS